MLDWLPENVSTYGSRIDFFFHVIYYLTASVFVLVSATMIYFLIKYRQREGRRATYTHGNATLEWVWTSATTVAMIALAFASKPLWGEIKQQRPPAEVEVRVTGKQFNWQILYPGPDRQFDTADDYQIDNDLHVPVNAVVHVHLNSLDVIHSFFVPQLRLKQDAVPGHSITAWFQATKPGVYEIPCAGARSTSTPRKSTKPGNWKPGRRLLLPRPRPLIPPAPPTPCDCNPPTIFPMENSEWHTHTPSLLMS
ncbi:cytochrome c oxidase subunit II [candidate division KSB1 bacterium]|nr:cytochrome c oxidase subunit II [candidate division KSB1 bacterium]